MSKPRRVIAFAANKKAAGIRRPKWMVLTSHHMTRGRRFRESGTFPTPVRAHVQNSAFAVSVAVLRSTINGAPLFDGDIMPDREPRRQDN
jgi:hypothetical protein